MSDDTLIQFARASAPKAAPSGWLYHVSPYGNNLNVLVGIEQEIRDIVDKRDSQLKDIPLTHEDSIAVWKAFRFLQELMCGRTHKEFDTQSVEEALVAIARLKEHYYLPKLEAVRAEYQRVEDDSRKLRLRYEWLMFTAVNNDDSLEKLEKEFYPDARWDPEAPEAIPAPEDPVLSSLAREKQQGEFAGSFKNFFRSEFVQNEYVSAQNMLGQPARLLDFAATLQNLHRMEKRNETVMAVVDDFAQGLQRALHPPQAKIIYLQPRQRPA